MKAKRTIWGKRWLSASVSLILGLVAMLGLMLALSVSLGGETPITWAQEPTENLEPFQGPGVERSPQPWGRSVSPPRSEGPGPPWPDFNRWAPGPRGLVPPTVGGGPGPHGLRALSASPAITVSLTLDSFWGYTAPSATLTATLKSGATFKGLAVAIVDGLGWFGNISFFDQGKAVDIASGDTVEFFVNGVKTTVTLLTITGGIDPATDVVSGTISGVSLPTNVTIIVHSRSRTVATDASGNFSTDWTGTADIVQDDWVDVAYEMTSGYWAMARFYPQNGFTVYETWNGVWGYTTPGETVTVTLRSITGTVKESGTATSQVQWGGGWWYGAGVDIVAGDQVEVEVGGDTITTTVSAITAAVDLAADAVSGIGPANSSLWINFSQQEGTASRLLEQTVSTASDGSYSADFSAEGIGRWEGSGYVIHTDPPRADTVVDFWAPYAVVDQTYDDIAGRAYVSAAIAITLTDSAGAVKDIRTPTADRYNGYYSAGFTADVVPGDTVQVMGGGISATIPITTLTALADRATDVISGQAPPNASHLRVRLWETAYGIGAPFYERTGFTSDASGLYTAALGTEVDVRNGLGGEVYYQTDDDLDEHIQAVTYYAPYLLLNPTFDMVQALAPIPDVPLTLTLRASDWGLKATTVITSWYPYPRGWFRWTEFYIDGNRIDIVPGDTVVMDTGTFTNSVTAVEIDTIIDPGADVVTGTGPAWTLLELRVRWGWPPLFVPTDGQGRFVADFSEIQDIRPSDRVQIFYITDNFNRVVYEPGAPWMRVNYGHDWVGGNYATDHTFQITVTDSGGAVKATAEIDTTPGGGWGGDGFQTEWDDWTPEQPDIEPGDWVYFQADDGYSNAIHVGTISGTVDVDNDSVSGPIYATWFTETLDVECHPWGAPEGTPGKDSTAEPDGSVPYFCQWDPVTEWDILPGQDVAVMYLELDDGDRVINVFYEPAPYLRINKRADGSPGEGGNFAFQIQYWNDGDGPAENTVITDTMLGGMTYITDTSSFTHTGSGTPADPIVWHLGTLPASSSGQFYVLVEVTAVESDTITNSAQIATSNPYDQGDPGEKESTWSVLVEANDTHLDVGKWAWTGDPVPGTDFVYAVNVCNNGSTGSSQVTLTDTLHLSMTLQTWWGQHPGWMEVYSDSHQLVVSRPSIPGGWCSEVYLRVHLDGDAWPGMYITNTAIISASNDLEDDDNEAFWDGWVGEPHTNLYISKQLEWAQLVSGREIVYEIDYGNNGNVPVNNVLITDTLPAGTTFVRSWRWTDYGEPPVTPTVVTADYVVWDIGTLDSGYGSNIGVALDIDDGVSPGAVLTNTVEISPQPGEDRYDDNTDTWVETLHNDGPNLRVSKYYRWEGESRIFYGIWVKNLGTTRMENIWITDTYPVSTTWNGDFWVGHGPWFTYTHDAPNHQFIIWAEQLDPGQTGHVGFWVDLDESIHGVQGLIFTNTVEAPWPEDVYPADNTDVELAYTGPDLYTEKWISDGEPRPGARITFTLRCGNSNFWPWEVSGSATTRLTERLPDGMSYVTSVWPDGNPHTPFFYDPGTGLIIWDMGGLGSDDYRWFYLVVDLDTDLEGDDVLLNQLEFQEWPIIDIDPNPDNNAFELPVAILNPKFKVDKTYESSGVAGMLVTYALTVTNVGSEDGTNVVLSDTLPAGMTYGGGDGSFDGSDVTWTFGSIAANGGTATGWFWGTLNCTAGLSVDNEHYRVVSSGQGITTPDGGPVSFTIVAPTLSPAFDQSATEIMIGETVYFTDTSTTDGTAIVAWAWDFGDGETGSGATVSHAYDVSGAYTVTLTITDTCGFSDSTAVSNAVIVSEYEIYLPLVLKNHS